METLAWIAAAITAFGVIAAAAWRLLRWARRISHFFDDWFGEPERPGVPARAGVMEQLADHGERLGQIEYQVFPDSGKSLHDQVGKHGKSIEDLTDRIDQLISESGG